MQQFKRGNAIYTYDALSQMTLESNRFTAKYDARYNLSELNCQAIATELKICYIYGIF